MRKIGICDSGVVIAHTIAHLKASEGVVVSDSISTAKPLSEIIERDMGITINTIHPIYPKMYSKTKKAFWKNGKQRFK